MEAKSQLEQSMQDQSESSCAKKLRDRKPSFFNTFEIFDHSGLPFDSPNASRGCLPEH